MKVNLQKIQCDQEIFFQQLTSVDLVHLHKKKEVLIMYMLFIILIIAKAEKVYGMWTTLD